MSTMLTMNSCVDATTALAVAVLDEKLAALTPEDRRDFREVLPYVFSEDQEERQSAIRTLNEILGKPAGKISPLSEPRISLEKWQQYIGERIHEEREKADLTQEQLAEKTGIGQSYICRLERGEHSPTNKTLTKIASALGIHASILAPVT